MTFDELPLGTNWTVVDPLNSQQLFVGTDVGVFSTSDGGLNWFKENAGFANVSVAWLVFDSNHNLYAFTHGRGVWRVAVPVGPGT